jgi:hypothetical protein
MPFVALKPIRFREGEILPGEEVPVEPGRDYEVMQRVGDVVWTEKADDTPVRRARKKTEKADDSE